MVGIGWNHSGGSRRAVALVALAVALVVGPTGPTFGAPTDGLPQALSVPSPACRARIERVLDEQFVAIVRAERSIHLTFDFRADSLFTTELGTDVFEVPVDHDRFWDSPVPIDRLDAVHGYGYRYHPILGYRRFHNGIDVGLPNGTPIAALTNGVVVIAGPRGGYGNTVVVDHGDGFTTLAAHMSAISVAVGDAVSAGETIGLVGSTGRSTGPHLHFETRLGGVPVNPLWFVPVLPPPETPDLAALRNTVAEPANNTPDVSAEFQIERLFLIAFGRLPDPAATAHWVTLCEAGVPLAEIAEQFVATPEFVDGLGLLPDAAFIEAVYRRALERPPTPEELDDATALLTDGFGRGRILADVSESRDHQLAAAAVLVDPSVRRLYLGVLGREPDAGGAYYWTARRANGESLEELASVIGASPEYEARFGETTDEEFVARIYGLVFGRQPDGPGLDFWVREVGRRGRWGVLVGFTESPEGQRLLRSS